MTGMNMLWDLFKPEEEASETLDEDDRLSEFKALAKQSILLGREKFREGKITAEQHAQFVRTAELRICSAERRLDAEEAPTKQFFEAEIEQLKLAFLKLNEALEETACANIKNRRRKYGNGE